MSDQIPPAAQQADAADAAVCDRAACSREPTKDSHRSITQSALRFLSGTALSRITGMIRDITLACSFGTQETLAALFVAFRLSHACRRIFGEGALQSAFVPLFEELRRQSGTRAFSFFRNLSWLWAILLAAVTVASMVLLWAVQTYFSLSFGTQEITSFMILLMPSLLPICLFGLNSSLLQCEKHYFTIGIAPIFFNFAIITGALLFRSEPIGQAMNCIALSMVAGCFFQWLATAPTIRALTFKALGPQKLWTARPFSPETRRLLGPLALGVIGVGASQMNNAIDAIFARIADPEGPAQLWFGIRIQQVPISLVGVALCGAILPPLSRAVQAQNTPQYLSFLEFGIRRSIAFLLPCTALLIMCGTFAINIIYGHGAFHQDSVISTGLCLQGYALSLVPTGLILVLAPALYAQKKYSTATKGTAISLICNTIFNAIFVFGLGWGAVSITIATGISAWMQAWYLYRNVAAPFQELLSREGKTQIKKTFIGVLLAAVGTYALTLMPAFAAICSPALPFSTNIYLAEGMIPRIGALAIPALYFTLLLGLLSCLMRTTDITHIFSGREEERP